LQERIRQIERSSFRTAEADGVSTGFPALDKLLPHGGLKRGMLIEWLGEVASEDEGKDDSDGEGSGATALALAVAAHILRQEGIFVVIDRESEFYPPAAASLGIPLERTVVVQPDTRMAALWAWEQSLRCPGVAVTFGWIDALGDRLLRRLQLGVETGGGWGFLLRPPKGQSAPSWASTRIGVRPIPFTPLDGEREAAERRLQVRLARGSLGTRDTVIEVELPHETSDVYLVSQLAYSAEAGRSARWAR
jgi:protein ImuA